MYVQHGRHFHIIKENYTALCGLHLNKMNILGSKNSINGFEILLCKKCKNIKLKGDNKQCHNT